MSTKNDLNISTHLNNQRPMRARVPVDGIISGTIGAVTLILWFLVLDMIDGKPLYTPEILSKALYKQNHGIPIEQIQSSFEIVMGYIYVHWIVLVATGGIASWLLGAAERNPNLGIGILILLILVASGSAAVVAFYEAQVLHVLAWPSILIGNLLAVTAMAGYFWFRHPHMKIYP